MRKRSLPAAIVIAAYLLVGLGSPPPAAAAIGVTTTANQTYELRPGDGLVHVTIDVAIKNTTPSVTTYEPCIQYYWDPYWGYTPYSTTCPHTTSYYINETPVWAEDGARNMKLTADAGSVSKSAGSHSAGFTEYAVKFQRIFYGKTRKIHVTYDLTGSDPRSGGSVKAGLAYASFCVTGSGPDGGQIKVVAPAGFDLTYTASAGLHFEKSESNGRVTFSSGMLEDPFSAWACFDGANLSGYARQEVHAADGRSVVVAGWPEDPAWSAAVATDVRTSLPGLEALVGRPLPGAGNVEIREVASTGLGDYAGFFSAESNVAVVGENYMQPGLVAHELSHAWFNHTNFASTWLSEGYAGWVESQNGGNSCARLPSYPGTGKPDLEDWTFLGPKATKQDESVVNYQYDAACWLIASVATRVGKLRMAEVIDALFDGRSPYGSTTASGSTPATWRAWLDAVDELGMVPAGESDLDVVQESLADTGIATDRAELAERSAARAAFHELVETTAGWTVPDAIRAPLTTWHFADAAAAMAAASDAYAGAKAAEAAVPSSNALEGPIKSAWESAATVGELEAVKDLAQREAAAAADLAAAEAIDASADPIAQLGLLGSNVDAQIESAVAALKLADPDAAAAATAAVMTALDGASGNGWLRAGLAIGVLLAITLLIAFVVRRARRKQTLLTGVPVAATETVGELGHAAAEPALATTGFSAMTAVGDTPTPSIPQTSPPATDRMRWLAGFVSDPESARAFLQSARAVDQHTSIVDGTGADERPPVSP